MTAVGTSETKLDNHFNGISYRVLIRESLRIYRKNIAQSNDVFSPAVLSGVLDWAAQNEYSIAPGEQPPWEDILADNSNPPDFDVIDFFSTQFNTHLRNEISETAQFESLFAREDAVIPSENIPFLLKLLDEYKQFLTIQIKQLQALQNCIAKDAKLENESIKDLAGEVANCLIDKLSNSPEFLDLFRKLLDAIVDWAGKKDYTIGEEEQPPWKEILGISDEVVIEFYQELFDIHLRSHIDGIRILLFLNEGGDLKKLERHELDILNGLLANYQSHYLLPQLTQLQKLQNAPKTFGAYNRMLKTLNSLNATSHFPLSLDAPVSTASAATISQSIVHPSPLIQGQNRGTPSSNTAGQTAVASQIAALQASRPFSLRSRL